MRWVFFNPGLEVLGWGKPSPRGYFVRRYPFEREVSRNALKFKSLPWLRSACVFAQAHLRPPDLRHFRCRRCKPP